MKIQVVVDVPDGDYCQRGRFKGCLYLDSDDCCSIFSDEKGTTTYEMGNHGISWVYKCPQCKQAEEQTDTARNVGERDNG